MKKKIVVILCAAVSVIALSLFLIFALSPNDGVVVEKKLNLEGTWRVYSSMNNGLLSLVEDEFIVFENGAITDFRDGSQYMTSAYKLDQDKLSLTDAKMSYRVANQSDNCIRLYQQENAYLQLVRSPGRTVVDLELKTDVLKGRWNVVFRPKENHGELEQIEFVDDSLRFYRNGASEPAMEAAWNSNEKGWLCVATMGKEFRLCKIDDTALVMVEQVGDVGFVWEMAPAEK